MLALEVVPKHDIDLDCEPLNPRTFQYGPVILGCQAAHFCPPASGNR